MYIIPIVNMLLGLKTAQGVDYSEIKAMRTWLPPKRQTNLVGTNNDMFSNV